MNKFAAAAAARAADRNIAAAELAIRIRETAAELAPGEAIVNLRVEVLPSRLDRIIEAVARRIG